MQSRLFFLLVCNLALALPFHLPVFNNQQPLLAYDTPQTARIPTQHLERVPRSAELLFTASDDDHLVHVWLPLQQRIYTRDYPVLPLHPTSARITNVLGHSFEAEARLKQEQVTCIIVTRAFAQSGSIRKELPDVVVLFQEADGVVILNEASSGWYLGDQEVESYECF